ncbi:5-(carboxyamino)imidazole ribonucleotide synthase [Sulfoacidibacillus ferrooxidans]|uniref:N5-carboxyaminoimidazole ribonucleotide synthase n=1 Tax=Sulfoacidibacillus ferrooxidans TaxID=2005001 RepID=A0A9X2ACP8_9BACL|nr:5-(carboxyamino)imidazole ribonucleotide synthase [Sulfoacidibacillus ferrooxidans]MCI0182560.1 N5-carboxyaminoimidazole ribonucleotide synthase [Sulfoacidibacillus ferrooxidans]
MTKEKMAIGILGAGQLAQMTCEAGRALGFDMHVYANHAQEPATFVADRTWVGDLTDYEQLQQFAESVSVITFDTELLPMDAVSYVAQFAKVYPNPDILWIAQHRERERLFLRDQGITMPRIAFVHTHEDIASAVDQVGVPAVLKTVEQGYDGKGQRKITRPDEAIEAWEFLGRVPCVLEEWLDNPLEMSVIVAGSEAHGMAAFPVIDNEHQNHILHQSSVPSQLPVEIQSRAEQIAIFIAHSLHLIGLLTIEMFYTKDGRVLVNELAPRPHNSGHHTQLSTVTSQFEQLIRAITGLELGDVTTKPAAMINLLGDLFLQQSTSHPIYQHVGFVDPHDKEEQNVFFYGKQEARVGRKLGHIIAVGENVQDATAKAQRIYAGYVLREDDVCRD